jgi:hypothetical protein
MCLARIRFPVIFAARELAADGFPPLLLNAMERHQRRYGTAAEVLSALRSIAVNDPICREIEATGGVQRITKVLREYISEIAGAAPMPPLPVVDAPASATLSLSELPVPSAAAVAAVVSAVGTGGGSLVEQAAVGTASVPGGGGGGGAAASDENSRRMRMIRAAFGVLRSLANSDAVKVRIAPVSDAPWTVLASSPAATRASIHPLCPRSPCARGRPFPLLHCCKPYKCCLECPLSWSM